MGGPGCLLERLVRTSAAVAASASLPRLAAITVFHRVPDTGTGRRSSFGQTWLQVPAKDCRGDPPKAPAASGVASAIRALYYGIFLRRNMNAWELSCWWVPVES
jgi:hypothetical protein